MGLLQNSVSICQFQIADTPPEKDISHWVGKQLERSRFVPIEAGSDELSIGWVQLHDVDSGEFDGTDLYRYDHYLAFSLRRDQRKLPAPLVKAKRAQAEADFLATNPGLNRVPKQKREEIHEAVRGALFARSLPVPAIFDAVSDLEKGLVTFCNLGGKNVDLFIDEFKKTFPPLRLVPLHPFSRALEVVDAEIKPALEAANQSSNDGVLEMIAANQWLGQDFLLWLTHATMFSSSDYSVSQPGPAVTGEGFTAYLNDGFRLAAVNEEGVQKVTVSGPQDNFREVCTALQSGKAIQEAIIFFEKGEQLWKLKLKGETFNFASFRSPGVQLEKDEMTDPDMERQALFLERMFLLETGLQLFHSLLATFLQQRLAPGWPQQEQQIRNQLEQRTS